MLSDAIREARQRVMNDAHGGNVVTSEDLLAQATMLAEWETEARNLEAQLARNVAEERLAVMLAHRARLGTFGRRHGGAR